MFLTCKVHAEAPGLQAEALTPGLTSCIFEAFVVGWPGAGRWGHRGDPAKPLLLRSLWVCGDFLVRRE